MNIYALSGHRVRCHTLDAGYDHDKAHASKHLKAGNEYTVAWTEVGSWHTAVYLQEFPDIEFNSVFFEDVIPQSGDNDRMHPDYSKYNS